MDLKLKPTFLGGIMKSSSESGIFNYTSCGLLGFFNEEKNVTVCCYNFPESFTVGVVCIMATYNI